jgi:hypothetical protein
MRCVCSIVGCGGVVKAHGFCNKHWLRLQRTGTTESGPRAPAPLEERFWRQVDRRKDNECWPWLGSTKAGDGYGRLGEGGKGGRYLLAHRVSCELHHGPAPSPRHVAMHACDNPSCVNPHHLAWATASENALDAFGKERRVAPRQIGEAHAKARLNADQVRFMRENAGLGPAALARLCQVTKSSVRAVLEGRSWKHLL